MLEALDILIGVVTLLLVVSLGVTVLTEFFISTANSRGRNLFVGIRQLLRQIDPSLESKIAGEISDAVLTHPLIQETTWFSGVLGPRRGTVVHREELTRLLLELASGDGPQQLSKDAKDALSATLTRLGIADAKGTLETIRNVALDLERSNPDLANNVRSNIAILNVAASDFVARINAWFDTTIDRVAQRFTFNTRAVTFACALGVATLFQIDIVGVVNRLSVDDELLRALVQEGTSMAEAGEVMPEERTRIVQDLTQAGLLTAPLSDAWRQDFWAKLPGVLLCALLLSLGAPFWYDVLKRLIRLRSALADKDDEQRTERQTSQLPVLGGTSDRAGTGGSVSSGPPGAGEAGDLSAVG